MEVWYPATKASVAGTPEATYNVGDWLPPPLAEADLRPDSPSTYPSGGVLGVPVAPGRYPLVVFSHGYAGYRDQSTFLTAFLATWGFVVAAPDHFSRDLTEVLGGPTGGEDEDDRRRRSQGDHCAHGDPGHRVEPVPRPRRHVQGRRRSAIPPAARPSRRWPPPTRRWRPSSGWPGRRWARSARPSRAPGASCRTNPACSCRGRRTRWCQTSSIVSAYGDLHSPKRLILIRGAGHLVFADLCEVGSGQGGLLAIAAALKVPIPDSLRPLATDGCTAPDLSPPTAWPVIRQAVTAQFRHVFGFDDSTEGLAGLASAYPAVVSADRAR